MLHEAISRRSKNVDILARALLVPEEIEKIKVSKGKNKGSEVACISITLGTHDGQETKLAKASIWGPEAQQARSFILTYEHVGLLLNI